MTEENADSGVLPLLKPHVSIDRELNCLTIEYWREDRKLTLWWCFDFNTVEAIRMNGEEMHEEQLADEKIATSVRIQELLEWLVTGEDR